MDKISEIALGIVTVTLDSDGPSDLSIFPNQLLFGGNAVEIVGIHTLKIPDMDLCVYIFP